LELPWSKAHYKRITVPHLEQQGQSLVTLEEFLCPFFFFFFYFFAALFLMTLLVPFQEWKGWKAKKGTKKVPKNKQHTCILPILA